MVAFESLSPLIRAFFAFWTFMLCLLNIGNTVLAVTKKRYLHSGLSFTMFISIYLMWQIIFDLSLVKKTGTTTGLTQKTVAVPWGVWFAILIAFTVCSLLIFVYNIRYTKNHITPGVIKMYLDDMPCGVCCWRINGRVLFSNNCMNRLCVELTGGPLLNGNHFYDAVAQGILEADGKLWRFTCRDIFLKGEILKEMIASDITTEYTKTQTLEKDKTELSRLNEELKEYNLVIDETVRRQEILQAKVNIHDEMNKLMLSTMIAENEDVKTLDDIFALWEQNALLLCMDADETADKKAVVRLNELADALKTGLVWQDNLPQGLTEEQRGFFFSAAHEALANAAKHAKAKTLYISFEKNENEVRCRFTNDGITPKQNDVSFTGGLLNLSQLAQEQGATVSVVTGEEVFTLEITFRINQSQ